MKLVTKIFSSYFTVIPLLLVVVYGATEARLVFSNEEPRRVANGSFVLDVSDDFDQSDLRFGANLDARIQYDKITDQILINRPVNFEGESLIDFRLETTNTASAPDCNGDNRSRQYFDTTDSKLKVCDGANWVFADGTLLDEDDFISDSGTLGATQQAISVYVNNFLERALFGHSDGKYVIEKIGGIISYVEIVNESPGGTSLFAQAPETINTLGISEVTSSSVYLSWAEPINNGDPITDYTIQYRISGAGTWTTANDGVNDNTSYQIVGLADDTTYEFRVIANNGNLSNWSDVLVQSTFIDEPFFDGSTQMMNVGGATSSMVAALEDNTVVTLNGSVLTTLATRGDTFPFSSSAYDVLAADKPIFVAGNATNDNVVWSVPLWAGKTFAFNATRSNPQTVKVYAFETATIELKSDTINLESPITLSAGESHAFSFSQYGSFYLESTGFVLSFHYADGYRDPKPLLPASRDIIGFPSSSMRVTAIADGTNYTGVHSNGVLALNALDRGNPATINPQGTSSLYESEALRLTADQPITGASYADSNGNCAAPFVPTSYAKHRYAVNVDTDYVALAALKAGEVKFLDATDAVLGSVTLTRSGSNPQAPYRARFDEDAFGGKIPAGTRIESTVPVAAWYQPGTSIGAGNDDETVMYGFD